MGRVRHATRRRVVGLAVALVLGVAARSDSQQRYNSGQDVVPVYEGWERNADGSFDMVFGYMNRNYEQHVEIPHGPNNNFEPAGVGQGHQPTHFYPRRQRRVFTVTVPADWGDKDLVWTLTVHGQTEKAYGSLWSVWENETSSPAPAINLVGPTERTVGLSEGLTLTMDVPNVESEGRPAASSRPAPQLQPQFGPPVQDPAVVRLERGLSLSLTWVLYQGEPGMVTFAPMRIAPVQDGKAVTQVTFGSAGNYVLRAYALDSDGGLGIVDVTVAVK